MELSQISPDLRQIDLPDRWFVGLCIDDAVVRRRGTLGAEKVYDAAKYGAACEAVRAPAGVYLVALR